MQKKVARGLGTINFLKKVFDTKTLIMLYSTLILPHISYCAEIWGNTYNSRYKQLTILQKRAIRILGKVGYLEHTNELFAKFRCLKFEDFVKLKTCVFIHKVENRMIHESLLHRYTKNEDVHSYNTRNKNKFCKKKIKKNWMGFCMSVRGVETYNNIPGLFKNVKKSIKFKKKLKSYILNGYRAVV